MKKFSPNSSLTLKLALALVLVLFVATTVAANYIPRSAFFRVKTIPRISTYNNALATNPSVTLAQVRTRIQPIRPIQLNNIRLNASVLARLRTPNLSPTISRNILLQQNFGINNLSKTVVDLGLNNRVKF